MNPCSKAKSQLLTQTEKQQIMDAFLVKSTTNLKEFASFIWDFTKYKKEHNIAVYGEYNEM
jgi:hypothetical protein